MVDGNEVIRHRIIFREGKIDFDFIMNAFSIERKKVELELDD